MRIYLIGFMGAGKTSLAKRLANRLNLKFMDLDVHIEEKQGKSINALFIEKGEEYFRELEKQWAYSEHPDNTVIALGGGTPCQEGIMKELNKKGVSVYIRPSIGVIVSRLRQAKTKRPLIEDFRSDKTQLTAFVDQTLTEREPFYFKSTIVFESSDVKADRLELLADLCTIKNKFK